MIGDVLTPCGAAWTSTILLAGITGVLLHVTGASHFEIYGANTNGRAGSSMASAGDFNNDGIMDMIICNSVYQFSDQEQVVAYIVYGAATIEDGVQDDLLRNVDLASLDSTQGLRIVGKYYGGLCTSAGALGDVNGDGIDDIVIGAQFRGAPAYVVFGNSDHVSDIVLDNMQPNVGVRLFMANNIFGYSVSRAGDVNGDGLNDIVVGVPWHSDYGEGHLLGRAFVVFGSPTLASTNLSHMSNTTGYTIYGTHTYKFVGAVVSSADVNGDGLSDVIIGSSVSNYTAFVLFGSNSTTGSDVYLTNSFNGFRVNSSFEYGGNQGGGGSGSMNALGDINGDGLDDFMVKSNALGFGGTYPLAVIFGKNTTTDIDLRYLVPSQGFHIIEGLYPHDYPGNIGGSCYLKAADGVLDYNGDGYADIAVAALCSEPLVYYTNQQPFVAVIFGGPLLHNMTLSSLDGSTNGFRIWGLPAPYFNSLEVSSAGMTSDGYSGLMVAAPYGSPYERANAGMINVFYGKNTTAGDLMVSFTPASPTQAPVPAPSATPTTAKTSLAPSVALSGPTFFPSYASVGPTLLPSHQPSELPSYQPTRQPSGQLTFQPMGPTLTPTSDLPTLWPTLAPTLYCPSKQPSVMPTSAMFPTVKPPSATR